MSELRLRDLPGLGPKSEQYLALVGIETPSQLKALGAIPAFLKLKSQNPRVSFNFLYALVGAIEGEHWLTIAKREKSRLIMELDGYESLAEVMGEQF